MIEGRAVTRFAPSPTGHLHLGHVAHAIYVWGVARALGGHVVLRVEDHDRIRSWPEYEAALLEDLAWLGFEKRQSFRGRHLTRSRIPGPELR
jgi:glutamyl/glutaminyl-tRNA synthetase